jgi:type IV secretion system protein VirD4
MLEINFWVEVLVFVVISLGVFVLMVMNLIEGKSETHRGKTPNTLLSLEPKGFIFGQRGIHYVGKQEAQDGHILVIGGAGCGKSSCIAIPSLVSWRERVFAVDIKGELYQHTRHKRPSLKALDPLSKSAYGYNPYYLLELSHNIAQDAREIALAVITKPQEVKEPFWIEGAQNLLTGAILHFYSRKFSFVETILTVQGTPVKQLIKQISESKNQEARLFISQFVDMDIKTLSSIYAELSNRIMVFATDPDIRDCLLWEQVITPMDLEQGYDVYLRIPEDKLDQWQGLLTLIVNQFMKHFERRSEEGAVPVLFLLDEFPRLGRVEAVKGLATLRSKKIVICIIAQSLAQLDVTYGKGNRQVIADNCPYKAVLRATDAETQEYFSRLVGTTERTKKSSSRHYQGQDTDLIQSTSFSETSEEKRLIKPEDFAILKDIVLLTPYGYSLIKKTPYYKVKAFQARRGKGRKGKERRGKASVLLKSIIT